MSARGALWIFHIFMGRVLERGFIGEGAYFETLKYRTSDFHMRFKINYRPSIFEKYIIFNIEEHI